MPKWLVRLAILAAVLAAVVLLKATLFAPEPLQVIVSEVATGRVEASVTNSRAGSVKARYRARLSPEIGGQAAEIPYREGERVTAGALLLRLEDSSQRARLRLAQRDLDAARAEGSRACLAAERASRELDRMRRLAEEEIVSTDLLDEIESAERTSAASCVTAEANVARAEAAVSVANTELKKTSLFAPFAGVIAEVTIEVGEWTTPSPPAMPVPAVIDMLDPTSIYVSAPMDEVDSAHIKTGQPARVTVDSHREQSFLGRVARVAPYVLDLQEQNRTIEIEVDLDHTELVAELLPGTSADVEVILDAREKVVRIPTSALMEGNRVLLLEADTLVERAVEPGLRNWDFTEIMGGLEGGELLVLSLDRPEIQPGARAVAAASSAGLD